MPALANKDGRLTEENSFEFREIYVGIYVVCGGSKKMLKSEQASVGCGVKSFSLKKRRWSPFEKGQKTREVV